MLSENDDGRKIQFCAILDDLIAFATLVRNNAEYDRLTKYSYEGLISNFHRMIHKKSDFVEYLCGREH